MKTSMTENPTKDHRTHQNWQQNFWGWLAAAGFVVAMVAYSMGSHGFCAVLEPLAAAESAIHLEMHSTSALVVPMALEVVNSVAVIVVGVSLYMSLRDRVSAGYLVARVLEGVILLVGTFWVLLPGAPFQSAHAVQLVRGVTFDVAMLILGLYSAFFFAMLAKRCVGNRWLMYSGALGYVGLVVYAVISLLFGVQWLWFFMPGGIFELVFPVYLVCYWGRVPLSRSVKSA